jgi:hypothetical protein
LDLLHKLTTLVTAVLLVVGTYALVNPNLRAATLASLPQTASAALAASAPLGSALSDLKDDLLLLVFGNPAQVNVTVEQQHP